MQKQRIGEDQIDIKISLFEKIRKKTAKVVVIGLGYVGLPKAALIASAGFNVCGVDVDQKIVDSINHGTFLTNEPKLSELIMDVTKRGLFRATLEANGEIKTSDIIVVCVQTPIRQDKTPDLSFFREACNTIAHNMTEGKLILLESTLPTNTTNKVVVPLLEEKSGLSCGQHFWLAFCPERIMPGKAIDEFINNPRIIGGFDPESTQVAAEFLKAFTKGNTILTEAINAEVAKLAENTFRDVNIAFANQLALICEQVGADVLKVIELANTHPRVNIHLPGPGVGGSCLPKDPYLLLHESKPIDCNVIKTARQMNDFMPHYAVGLVLQGLLDVGKDISKSKIAVLGTAYKCDVDDSRFSPAKTIIDKLSIQAREIVVYDPICSETFGAKKEVSLEKAIEGADSLVILTDHANFKSLNLLKIRSLMKKNPVILDTKRIIDYNEAKKHGFHYLRIGLGIETRLTNRVPS